MSDWSNAGLPPLQMRGYTGTFVPGIKRTSFRTAHPSQTIRERRQFNGIFETFLTHSQLVAAEAFIENVGYLAFTITTVTNENYLVRLMRSPEINSMSGETYRYVIHVDIPNALRSNFRYDWSVLESFQSSNFEYNWGPVFNSVQSSNFEYRWNILVQSNNFEYNWQVFDTLVQSDNFEYNWQIDSGGGGTLPTVPSWLCWPSADNAPYGWGDPYEDPPGTLVNPPLGTVQLSYSDTAHIARELGDNDIVTHGVNKIAAPRDWRDVNSRLVVSWDSTSVYSGGAAIVASGTIAAACVRYTDGVSELLWMDTSTNPWRVYAQPCTIVDDVIEALTGVSTYCTLQNPSTDQYWSEFDDDAIALIVCSGSNPVAHVSDSYAIPALFTGQSVAGVREAETQPYDNRWGSNSDYDGSRKYLIKSQYVAGNLEHCWADVLIHESPSETTRLDFVSYASLGVSGDPDGVVRPPDYYQASSACGSSSVWTYSDFDTAAGYNKILQQTVFNVNVNLSFGDTVIASEKLVEDSIDTTSWCQGYDSDDSYWICRGNLTTEGYFQGTSYPVLPGPDGGPAPVRTVAGACSVIATFIDAVTVRDYIHKSIYFPQNMLDLKTKRYCKFDCGYVDVANSSDWTKYFRVSAFRNGIIDSVEIQGDFGEADLPVQTTITFESKLREWLDKIANDHFPNVTVTNTGSTSQGASIDIAETRCAFSAWAQSETDGQFKYVNFLENADIEVLLSIDGQPNPSIVIKGSDRYFGVLKQ